MNETEKTRDDSAKLSQLLKLWAAERDDLELEEKSLEPKLRAIQQRIATLGFCEEKVAGALYRLAGTND